MRSGPSSHDTVSSRLNTHCLAYDMNHNGPDLTLSVEKTMRCKHVDVCGGRDGASFASLHPSLLYCFESLSLNLELSDWVRTAASSPLIFPSLHHQLQDCRHMVPHPAFHRGAGDPDSGSCVDKHLTNQATSPDPLRRH